MRVLIEYLIALIYFPCLDEATPESPQDTSIIWNGAPGDPLLTCTFVEISIIIALLICKMFRLGLDLFEFVTFMARLLFFPLNSLFGIIVIGIIYGAKLTTDICLITLDLLVNYSSSFCPSIFESLDNLPNSIH